MDYGYFLAGIHIRNISICIAQYLENACENVDVESGVIRKKLTVVRGKKDSNKLECLYLANTIRLIEFSSMWWEKNSNPKNEHSWNGIPHDLCTSYIAHFIIIIILFYFTFGCKWIFSYLFLRFPLKVGALYEWGFCLPCK